MVSGVAWAVKEYEMSLVAVMFLMPSAPARYLLAGDEGDAVIGGELGASDGGLGREGELGGLAGGGEHRHHGRGVGDAEGDLVVLGVAHV